MTAIRIILLGLLATAMLCSGCGGDTSAALEASDLLNPSPVADDEISSGVAFDGQSAADEDYVGSAVRN